MTVAPVDFTPSREQAVPVVILTADNADRYLSLVERIMLEQLSGVERVFGREQAVDIVSALAKKYPVGEE